MKIQDSPVPHGVIFRCPDEEVTWCSTTSFINQDDHWFNCTDCFHLYRKNTCFCYLSNLILLFSVWLLITSETSLVVCVNVWWVEGENMCLLEIVLGDCRGWKFESFPCRNGDIIYVSRYKLDGSMVSHPVQYCITIQILELHVWTVIVWLVMHRITCLKDEILDAVSTKYIQCPIIKMYVTAIIK